MSRYPCSAPTGRPPGDRSSCPHAKNARYIRLETSNRSRCMWESVAVSRARSLVREEQSPIGSCVGRPLHLKRVQEVDVARRVAALREVARQLAAMLRPVVHDMGDDQPTRDEVVRVRTQRHGPGQRLVVEELHVAPQASALFEAEAVDGGEVVELEPVVPHVGLADVVPDAELAPAPVDVDEMSERLEGTAVVENRLASELLIANTRRRRQDAVVRPRVEADEYEEAVDIHGVTLRAVFRRWLPLRLRLLLLLAAPRLDVQALPRIVVALE